MSLKNNISDELQALNISLPSISMPAMELPEAYFDKLSDEIVAQMNTIHFVDGLSSLTPFEIPDQYFDHFSTELAAKIHADTFLATLPVRTPFQVPSHYFEDLSEEVVNRTQSEIFISSLSRQVPYYIPSGYFENFTDIVISKTMKVNNISPLRATRTFYGKMSIAASLLVILGLGFLIMIQSNPANIETELAHVSDAEINSYIQEHAFEFDNHLSYQPIDESKIDINKLENEILNAYFENISDDEINNYL